jgi:hypothetical protein
LKFLDLLTGVSLASLNEAELKNLRRLSDGLSTSTVMECIKHYPARTSKRLLESETIGVFA